MLKIDKICLQCGSHFTPEKPISKYCSRKCYNQHRDVSNLLERKCTSCFLVKPIDRFRLENKKRRAQCIECRKLQQLNNKSTTDGMENEQRKYYRGRFKKSIQNAKRRGIDWLLSQEEFLVVSDYIGFALKPL